MEPCVVLPAFTPDEYFLMIILRDIEDVLHFNPRSNDFVELIDSVEPTTTVDAIMNTEWTASVDQMAEVDPTATVDPKMDGRYSSDRTNPINAAAFVNPTKVYKPGKFPLTFRQLFKLMVKRLFEVNCSLLQNYLMVIMKCSTLDKSIRLICGWLLNYHLKYYYEVIPSSVIAYLRTECLTSIGDNSPRVRDFNCSLITKLALKGLSKWPEIWPAITEMLDSDDHNIYNGGLEVLQMISKKFKLKDYPNIPFDILIPKLIIFLRSPCLTKRSMSVSIVKELIVQKTPSLLNYITLLMENLLDLDDEHIKNMNDANNKILLHRNVCISITTLVKNKCLPLDEYIIRIIHYMMNRTRDMDDTNVKEACTFWITFCKEQADIYRIILTPYLYDIISCLADQLIYTQEDLISIKDGEAIIDYYPILTESDSIRKHCFYAIRSMAFGFKEDILPGVVQIINRKVSDTDLKIQVVAIVLLGCIADSKECSEAITPYLEIPFNKLILFNNHFIPGESVFRDKLLWTLIAYREYLFNQPQFLKPMMKYMLRSEIDGPDDYPFLEEESFWNLVIDENLSKDAFRPYLTRVLSIIFNGLYNYNALEVEEYEKTNKTDHCMSEDSIDAITNLIGIYKADILPIIMPLIDEFIAKDDTYSKESGIVVLGLLAKGGIGDMVTELPQYLSFMVDTLLDHNRRLSAVSCSSLGRFHDLIVNHLSHDKYFVPLMEYLLSTETKYISSDPYTLSCGLFTLELLLLDKTNSIELFAPYLRQILIKLCKAIVYSNIDIFSLQDDDKVDIYYLDSPMIICKRFDSSFQNKNAIKKPLYKCSSDLKNRGKAAHILNYITSIYKCRILPIIMPIIQSALKSDNWRIMESGIFALGIINHDVHIYKALNDIKWFPYYQEFLKCLLENLSSKRPIVRANTMVTLSRYSFHIIKKCHKKCLISLLRMISSRVLDSNLNVRSTAWQVWNILRRELINDKPIMKRRIDLIWKRLINMVESYRRILRGEDYSLTNTRG